jgi:hypothetical protein
MEANSTNPESQQLTAMLRTKLECEDFFHIRQDFASLLEYTERLERDLINLRCAKRNLKTKYQELEASLLESAPTRKRVNP